MKAFTFKGLVGALILVSVAFGLSACNTSKATIDTFAKFTSSTSPSEWMNGDGMIKEDQKARLFASVVFENLEQDIARGHGEYLTSLGVLMKIPAKEQEEFRAYTQSSYPLLFVGERRTAESLLGTLTSQRNER